MIAVGTNEEASLNPRRLDVEKGYTMVTQFLKSSPEERPSPYAVLVKQSPHSEVRPHFHHASQFQVIVHGSGKIGKHEMRPLSVHYAGQHTGYGPLIAGPEGLWYLTLRAVSISGIYYLPESSKDVDREIPKSQVTTPPGNLSSAAELKNRKDATVEELIAPKDSGLAVWLMRQPPNTTATPPAVYNSVGRYYLVSRGSIIVEGRELPELATIWVSGEEDFVVKAGSNGAEVAVMQFPANAWQLETLPANPPAPLNFTYPAGSATQ